MLAFMNNFTATDEVMQITLSYVKSLNQKDNMHWRNTIHSISCSNVTKFIFNFNVTTESPHTQKTVEKTGSALAVHL